MLYCGAYQWSKFSPILSAKAIFISSLISSNQLFPLVAEFRLNFEKFSISPLQAYSFYCWFFSNDSVITFLEGCFPSSFVAEVGIFFSIRLFQWFIFYSFFRRHCDVDLFTHHLNCEDRVLFVLIHLTGVLCLLFKFFSSSQVFLLLSVRLLPKLYQSYSFSI